MTTATDPRSQAETIIRIQTRRLLDMWGFSEPRMADLTRTLSFLFGADVEGWAVEDVVRAADDIRRIEADDADLIPARPNSPEWGPVKAQTLAAAQHHYTERIANLLTDRVVDGIEGSYL